MSKKGENIYKRKDGRWEGRYKKSFAPDGRALYGYCYGKSYREVRDKLNLRKAQPFGEEDNTCRQKKLFGEYCDEWLSQSRTRVKESTAVKYKTAVDKHIKPFFGGYLPEAVTPELVSEFLFQLTEVKGLSAKSAGDMLVILKSISKHISRFGKCPDFSEVRVLKQSPKEMRVMTQEEQKRLVRYLLSDMDSYKFGTLFALMTGLRIGEVCALKNGDISLKEKTVTVRETMQRLKNLDGGENKTKIIISKPKTDTSARVVPLTDMAFGLCQRRVINSNQNAFLLTGSEVKFTEPRTLQYHIKKYSEACGIENLHFHTLRHTFATRCVEVGFEIKSLSEVLGHSSPKITLERYVHSSIEFKRQNMSKLEAVGF